MSSKFQAGGRAIYRPSHVQLSLIAGPYRSSNGAAWWVAKWADGSHDQVFESYLSPAPAQVGDVGQVSGGYFRKVVEINDDYVVLDLNDLRQEAVTSRYKAYTREEFDKGWKEAPCL